MELFVINRHAGDDQDDKKESETTEVEEKTKLDKIFKRIERNKKIRNKQKERENKLKLAKQRTLEARQIKRELKAKIIPVPDNTNDEFIDKTIAEEAKVTEGSMDVAGSSKKHKKQKLDVKTLEGFTILGDENFVKKNKVKRVLPKWLANPTVVSVNLQNLQTKVSEVKQLDKRIRKLLKANGIKYFFPVQAEVIPWLLKANKHADVVFPRDICVSAPTGSGKTLAFVLPVIQALKKHTVKKIRALVILPTQDLANQVFKTFKTYSQNTNLDVCLITGNNPFTTEQRQLITENKAFGLLSRIDILVCTAGRLVDHLKMTKGFTLQHLEFLIIDEADRVLENVQNDWLYHLEKHLAQEDMQVSSESSNKSSFKCCKTKSFIHYVCIKCYGIYHKSCLPKYKRKTRFINGNKLVCCEEDSVVLINHDDEKEILERTINELSEDSEMKNNYIKKIKADGEAFVLEASKREDELFDSIKKQEKIIQELNECILAMKNQTTDNQEIEKISTGTQTILILNKNASTSTVAEQLSGKKTETNKSPINSVPKNKITNHKTTNWNDIKNQSNNPDINTISNKGQENAKPAIHRGNNNFVEISNLQVTDPMTGENTQTPKKRILILSDEINIHWKIRNSLDLSSYEILSIRKPGAFMHQLIDKVENLTKNFTFDDHIVILGGSNDIGANKTPSFKLICSKLKLMTQTNILFVSIPYCYKHTYMNTHINKHIFKFNLKLYDFINKFNNCSEGHIGYIDINSSKPISQQVDLAASKVVTAIKGTKKISKTLRFINTGNENKMLANNLNISPPSYQQLDTELSLLDHNISNPVSSTFLYPRLSRITIID